MMKTKLIFTSMLIIVWKAVNKSIKATADKMTFRNALSTFMFCPAMDKKISNFLKMSSYQWQHKKHLWTMISSSFTKG